MINEFSGGAWRQGKASGSSRYAFGFFMFVVALVARYMLVGILPAKGFPFLTFFPAILLTAYLVGLGPGLMISVLSTMAAWAFFMGPIVPFAHMQHSDLIALVFFAGILIVDCLVIERMNSAMRRLRATGDKLRASEEALVAGQIELREASKQKDIFIATLAHELRNPLAAVLSAAQLLKTRANREELVLRTGDIINRQSLQLKRLVDDLLDVSRMHSSKLQLELATVDLSEVVSMALETTRPLTHASTRTLSVELDAVPMPVHADRTRMSQSIANLLHNAFKFTDATGNISLKVARLSASTVAITVTDDGRGISAEMLPRLFDMFAQEELSGSSGNSGLGIGLALAHYLVKSHGGTLTARSDGRGKGACFEITLPMVDSPAAAPPLEHEQNIVCGSGRILIVDDNRDAAESLQALLEIHGFDVVTDGTGAAALARLAVADYDAVLLDIGLPDMSGYEVAARARQDGLRFADTTVVALTGWSDVESRRRSVEAGIDHHLNKPVSMAQLLPLLCARV